MKKHFLIEFEYDERTRWLYDDKETGIILSHLAASTARMHTTGPEPSFAVTSPTMITIATITIPGKIPEGRP